MGIPLSSKNFFPSNIQGLPTWYEVRVNENGFIGTRLGVDLIVAVNPQTFAKGFVPNSINIGIDGSFAPWVGAMIPDIKQEILLITDEGREEEVITRLARVGYDFTIGYLKGGFTAWENSGKEIDQITSISADELATLMSNEKVNVLDVRKQNEYLREHVIDANNTPLDFINDSMAQIDKSKTYYVHCASGYRSMIFNSILRARGFDNLVDVSGGFKSIKDSGKVKLTDYVCPSTLL